MKIAIYHFKLTFEITAKGSQYCNLRSNNKEISIDPNQQLKKFNQQLKTFKTQTGRYIQN